jgi:hypothetical protein
MRVILDTCLGGYFGLFIMKEVGRVKKPLVTGQFTAVTGATGPTW